MLLKDAKKILNSHKKDLSRLGVRALALFGSVARDQSTDISDIDVGIFRERGGRRFFWRYIGSSFLLDE